MAVLVVVRYMLDDSIKTSDDVEKYLGLSTLALIPLDEGINKEKAEKRQEKEKQKRHQKCRDRKPEKDDDGEAEDDDVIEIDKTDLERYAGRKDAADSDEMEIITNFNDKDAKVR